MQAICVIAAKFIKKCYHIQNYHSKSINERLTYCKGRYFRAAKLSRFKP